jgi:ABC-type branched-subunit amino acid transport system substrate-binding protein
MKGSAHINIIAVFFMFFCLLAGTIPAIAQGETRKHIVTDLDNFYSLSLKYDVSIEELKLANPGILNPRPGDVLVIPQKGSVQKQNEPLGDCLKSSKNKNEVYRVALMIPLHLEQLEDTLWVEKLDPAKISELAPFRFIQFYHGFMMAADSLRQKGLKVEISVYDVDHLVSKTYSVLREPDLKNMDLIIGPFFKSTFGLVADFAREHKIPVINPLSSRNDILAGNPYVFKVIPSVESQPDLLSRLVKRDYSDHKIIFYIPNKYQDQDLVAKYIDALEKNNIAGKPGVTLVDFASDSAKGLRDHVSHIQPNLVIVFSGNEVLPAALLSKLSAMKNDYRISLIGLPEWEKFTNIESVYLIALDANIFMASYTDYQSVNVKNFILGYRARYFDEPLEYAFSGFDTGYYFLYALMHYGKHFERCTEAITIPLLQNQFRFKQTEGGGYDNVNWNVLQYFDYSLFKKSL